MFFTVHPSYVCPESSGAKILTLPPSTTVVGSADSVVVIVRSGRATATAAIAAALAVTRSVKGVVSSVDAPAAVAAAMAAVA